MLNAEIGQLINKGYSHAEIIELILLDNSDDVEITRATLKAAIRVQDKIDSEYKEGDMR